MRAGLRTDSMASQKCSLAPTLGPQGGDQWPECGGCRTSPILLCQGDSVERKAEPRPPGKSSAIKEDNTGPGLTHGPFPGPPGSTSRASLLRHSTPGHTILW
ncbi:Carbonic Anhydrase 14 [Manis pentadactyla]|nr:Carbonic Anhydrase 14 [Manis pentadactyla]